MEPESDEQRLNKQLGGTDPDRLLAFLKNQVLTDAMRTQFQKWIEEMGDRKFSVRQAASKKLIEAGPVALPALREATNNADREIASRAKRCMAEIESGPRYDLPMSVVRQLVRARHEKTVDALLEYFPTLADENFQAEVLKALAEAGTSGGRIHPSLMKALDDADATRRAAAVQILLRVPDGSLRTEGPALRPKIRAKLKDPDSAVRFHVAIGLAALGDRDAVAVLIELIKSAANPAHWQHAEEVLYTLAGELAPHPEVGEGTVEARKKISEQWAEWWSQRGGQVLLGQKDDRPTDAAVIADTQGRVFDWRPDDKPRFDIKNLTGPVDVRVLPGNRVLIAEESSDRVAELDYQGKVIWEHTFDEGPVSVQRLPNGNTFVALYSRVVEVRRDGQIVSSIPIPGGEEGIGRISDANKFPDGRIACLCSNGQLLYLTSSGKEVLSKQLQGYGGVDWLPNGNLLCSLSMGGGKIQEIDPTGKIVWECNSVPKAWVGTRLPDGNTLITSKADHKMYKVDTKGQVLWEKEVDGRPHAMHWK
jgi:HEAT repeat protein